MKKKQPTKKRDSMFINIRINSKEEVELIEAIVSATKEVTNTGALMKVAKDYIPQRVKIGEQEAHINLLRGKLNEAERILELFSTFQSNLTGYAKKFQSGKHYQPKLY